ncbi:MAG: hypothetical protein GXP26_17665 [Planctomycetes bacterium]|nr:hypothetical protein [Planctomycetota bacterium]
MTSHLVDWTPQQFAALEEEIFVAKHNLHETGLFDDENLIKLFDLHPEVDFGINTMSTSNQTFSWREGDRNGVSSEMLLELLYRGHLWVNLRNVRTHHPDVRKAIDSIYDELEANNPNFQAQNRSANLLISSPGAIVYYHIDVPVNMLWHIRGRKRAWVYPPFDTRFSPQEVVENICAAEMVEDAPFDPSFDESAQIFDAEPGQLITWPQLTPHRVENLNDGLCISLSTEHRNPRATRRINVHLANQFLRRTFGMSCRSFEVEGVSAHAKQAVARAVRGWKKIMKSEPPKNNDYEVSFKVDPQSPQGFTLIDGATEPVAPTNQVA